MNNIIPLKLVGNDNFSNPWFTKYLKNLRNRRNKAWKSYISNPSAINLDTYRRLLDNFNSLSKSLYSDYLSKMSFSLKDNPKRFWKFINSKKKSDGYPVQFVFGDKNLKNTEEVCNAFASHFSNSFCDKILKIDENYFEYLRDSSKVNFNTIPIQLDKINQCLSSLQDDFSSGPDGIPPIILKNCRTVILLPLMHIFELSIATGNFPSIWKNSFIKPVFKKGDKNDIINYRPIAKLSCIPKVFEQVICESLSFYTRNLICNQQHGFMQKRSTVTNLLSFLNQCSKSLEKGHELDCIYTDFSKAFDQLSHNIILFKLDKLGFPPTFIKWISNYLSNRIYQVKFRNSLSNSFIGLSGVPQGSHLGPLLFILAINDVTSCISFSKILIYADDMKIFKTIHNLSDYHNLQSDINSFEIWCNKNGLVLNPSKCQFITFSKKKFPRSSVYKIYGQNLCQVSNLRDLGVNFNCNLVFDEHINSIINKASSMLGFIKRWSKEFIDPYVTLSLYNCYVRPHLEYASQVWTPFYEIHKTRIEAVQHKFIRFALKGLAWEDPYNLPPYEHRIQLLHLQTLSERRVNNDLIFFHQLITGVIDAPELLSSISFNFRSGSYQLRNLDFIHCDFHRTNYGMHEPITRLSRLYNLNSYRLDFHLSKSSLKCLLRTSVPLA